MTQLNKKKGVLALSFLMITICQSTYAQLSDMTNKLTSTKSEFISFVDAIAPYFFIGGGLGVVAVFLFKNEGNYTKPAVIGYVSAIILWAIIKALF